MMGSPMACPVCGKPAEAAYRPFCSRRCADVDLGRWFNEDYRIPAEETNEEKAEETDEVAGGETDEESGAAADTPRGALAH